MNCFEWFYIFILITVVVQVDMNRIKNDIFTTKNKKMKTKVAIKGAEFYAYHGFYEEERLMGNTFLLDAEVTLKSFDTTEDNIYDTVNYEEMYKICQEEMTTPQKLLETVVYRIISRFKEELTHIVSASVRLEKLNPPVGGKVEKSAVEMEF